MTTTLHSFVRPGIFQKLAFLLNGWASRVCALKLQPDLREGRHEPLVAACMNERDNWRALQAFRRNNGLSRSARYHARHSALLIVAVILFGETLLNGFAFIQSGDQARVGGFVLAFFFSLVNILTGFVVPGRMLLPSVSHARVRKRVAAIAFMPLVMAGAVYFNLLMARYRSLIEVNPDDQHRVLNMVLDTLASLPASPADLHSVHTVWQLATGLFVFVVAAIAAWRFYDDPYAGYGALDRRHKSAQRAYEAANGITPHPAKRSKIPAWKVPAPDPAMNV